ncbi:serine threonine- kinase pim-2-like protein [Labeo rohita]|uniref:non-specific serine/threonine protein kinase n=1 Tax=Labeo rohita TaxID=84645 RepID=A0A498MCG8_LABRO|nr:serine threonine- kinase pim-2-like protein [Labeo rohita]
MGQRFSRVTSVDDGEVYDYHHSTPPKPGTDKAKQHLHPRDEPPVDAGEGGAQRIEKERTEGELEVQREEERKDEELQVRKEEERKEEELDVRREEETRKENLEVQREKELEVQREQETREEKLEVRREEERKEEELEVQKEEERKEEEEKKKRKKRFWRLPTFLKAARKHLKRICHGQTKESPSPASSTDDDIMSRYKLGDRLGVGGFGVVYEASRVEDGLKVAVKDVMKTHDMEYLTIPDHPNPLPVEIALTLLANKGPSVPEIIKLLEWQEQRDSYIMVLECPSPCKDLVSLLEGNGGRLSEGLVRRIMQQATQAARTCCHRGVFHGDVKLENFLMSKDTLQVKLIDFGCGDLMRKSAYTTLYGTMEYYPPEYRVKGKYHAKSALSWSLGVILFTMLCGRFPTAEDLQKTELKLWSEPGLSKDCCHLICSLLQHKPKRRLSLGKILRHDWFQPPMYIKPEQTEDQYEENVKPDVSMLPIDPSSDKKDVRVQPLSSTSASSTEDEEYLSKDNLLKLLGIMEGEIQAREDVIHLLRSALLSRPEQLESRYGASGPTRPLQALQRDRTLSNNHAQHENVYDKPMAELDRLQDKHKESYRRMLEQLLLAEKSHRRTVYELDTEKRKHVDYMNKSDDFTNLLEQERER